MKKIRSSIFKYVESVDTAHKESVWIPICVKGTTRWLGGRKFKVTIQTAYFKNSVSDAVITVSYSYKQGRYRLLTGKKHKALMVTFNKAMDVISIADNINLDSLGYGDKWLLAIDPMVVDKKYKLFQNSECIDNITFSEPVRKIKIEMTSQNEKHKRKNK